MFTGPGENAGTTTCTEKKPLLETGAVPTGTRVVIWKYTEAVSPAANPVPTIVTVLFT